MQLAFFLTPKSDTLYLVDNFTLRQAMEKMQYHGYSSVPVLDNDGKYIGAITTGDILWYIKDLYNLSLADTEKIKVSEIPRRYDNVPVAVNARLSDIIEVAMLENFIPVIDDLGVFIGIVRRREIMEYYQKQIGV